VTTTSLSSGLRRPNANALRAVVPYAVLVLLYVVTVMVAPGYLAPAQIGSLLQLATILGIVAIGQMLVILVGGIDLSVGSVVTLANLTAASLIDGKDGNLPVALVASLAVGVLTGLVNGLIISYLKVPDLVATLATMTIVIGVGYLVTNGAPRGSSSPLLNGIMTSRLLGVLTVGALLWFALAAATIVVLRFTTVGRRVYAVGLNRDASRYAAVSTNRTVIILYVLSGLAAAFAGVLLTGYTGSSYLGSGASYQLASIAAVVLGGVSIFGGRGGYGGTIAGVVITVLLLSILQVVGIPQAGQNITYGIVILLMLIAFTSRRSTR
jgi:ribose transport system permease protein